MTKFNPFIFLHIYNQLVTVTFTIFLFLSTNYFTNFPCIIFKYCNRLFPFLVSFSVAPVKIASYVKLSLRASSPFWSHARFILGEICLGLARDLAGAARGLGRGRGKESSPYLTPAPILSRLAPISSVSVARAQINLAQNKSRVRPKWRACSQAM